MTSNKPALIATIVVALIAVAVAFFAFWKIDRDKQEEQQGKDALEENKSSTYIPSEEISEEMKDAAERLIKNNYTVVKLYFTQGLPKEEEPYGNRPESGIYFADSETYKTLDDVHKILDETFFKEEAERIKTDPQGKGPVYAEREGRLGISETFEPEPDYPVNWNNPSFIAAPKSDTSCELKITLTVDGTEITETLEMTKIDGEWKLERIIY